MKKITLVLLLVLNVYTLQAQLDSIIDQGVFRTYIIHLPSGYNTNNKYPLVFSLHGLRANALQQKTITQFDKIADQKGFIVVYPNGTDKSWTTVGNKDLDFLSNLVDSIRYNYSTNDCLFMMGFSQGGFMTYKFALNSSHSLKAIAVGSGNISKAAQTASENAPQIPVLHFHGNADNIVPFNGTPPFIPPVENTIEWLVSHNGCDRIPVVSTLPDIDLTDNSTVEKYYYGNGDNDSEVTYYKITGGGHTWSGSIPVPIFGETNQDINQSAIIGDYFEKFCSETNGIPNEKGQVFFSLYPNPFNNQLTIQSYANEELTFILYDNLSRKILNERCYNNLTINTDFLSNGIYYYKIQNSNEKLKSGKVIKN